jgi:hypothetical protein
VCSQATHQLGAFPEQGCLRSDTRDPAGLGLDREPGPKRRLWLARDTQLAALLISLASASNRPPLAVDFHYSVDRADLRVQIAFGRSRANLSRRANHVRNCDQHSCEKHLKRQSARSGWSSLCWHGGDHIRPKAGRTIRLQNLYIALSLAIVNAPLRIPPTDEFTKLNEIDGSLNENGMSIV